MLKILVILVCLGPFFLAPALLGILALILALGSTQRNH